MGDNAKRADRLADLRERLSFLRKPGRAPLDRFWDVRNVLCDWSSLRGGAVDYFPHRTALKAAADYFGLNPRDFYELEVLAYLMAWELFGPRKKGRPHGKDFWTDRTLFDLGSRRYELKIRDKSLTEEQIAEIVSKAEPFRAAYKDRPEQIRQHLPAARRSYSEYLEEKRNEGAYDALRDAYESSKGDEDDGRDEYE
jgi:hypothetical protein